VDVEDGWAAIPMLLTENRIYQALSGSVSAARAEEIRYLPRWAWAPSA